jgi:hypothetical protein
MMIFFMYGLLYDASNSLFYSIDDSDVIWARYESSVFAIKWNWNEQHVLDVLFSWAFLNFCFCLYPLTFY